MSDLFHNRLLTARIDVNAPIRHRQNRHVLFGRQAGRCNGCRREFSLRNFTIDHIVPESRNGTNHIEENRTSSTIASHS